MGGRKKNYKQVIIILYSILQILFTTSWVAASRTKNGMGWQRWPALIVLASSGRSWQEWAVSFKMPLPSLIPIDRAICQWSTFDGSVAGRGDSRGPHKLLGLLSPWHPSSPKTTKLSLKIGVALSRLKSRSLKWSCLGVWAPPGDLFIPPLEGGPQSRHACIQMHSINTWHLWWKTGEKRQTYPSHARSTSSFLLIRSHKRNNLSCYSFCAWSSSPGMAVGISLKLCPSWIILAPFYRWGNDAQRDWVIYPRWHSTKAKELKAEYNFRDFVAFIL